MSLQCLETLLHPAPPHHHHHQQKTLTSLQQTSHKPRLEGLLSVAAVLHRDRRGPSRGEDGSRLLDQRSQRPNSSSFICRSQDGSRQQTHAHTDALKRRSRACRGRRAGNKRLNTPSQPASETFMTVMSCHASCPASQQILPLSLPFSDQWH